MLNILSYNRRKAYDDRLSVVVVAQLERVNRIFFSEIFGYPSKNTCMIAEYGYIENDTAKNNIFKHKVGLLPSPYKFHKVKRKYHDI